MAIIYMTNHFRASGLSWKKVMITDEVNRLLGKNCIISTKYNGAE